MLRSLTILCLLFHVVCQSQVNDTSIVSIKSKKELLRALPTFSIFGTNYFITGTALNETPNSENSDAKFQLGFKQLLTRLTLPYETIPFFTYRQKSFWNIYMDSFPFRETNYNPGLGLAKLWFKDGKINQGLWFQFEHESNGMDGENSRSWNFLSLRFSKPIGNDLQLLVKGWLPVGSLSDNPDITSYRGYFQLDLAYRLNERLYLEGEFRNAVFDTWRGSAQLSLSYKPFRNSNQFLYLQYFGGFSEDLANYDQAVSRLRIGIAFKDLFANFN